MTTVVNNPGDASGGGGGGMGFFLGMLMLVVVVFVLLFWGLPYLRQGSAPVSPDINVPDRIDVNVDQPQEPQAQ